MDAHPDDEQPSPASRLSAAVRTGSAALGIAHVGRLACLCHELAGCCVEVVLISGERGPAAAAAALRFFEPRVAGSARFAAVTTLRVHFCDGLLDDHLRHVPPQLVELELHYCQRLTDMGVRAAVERCGPTLEVLSVYWNNHVSNASVIAAGRRCVRLRAACFSGCKRVGSAGVRALAARGATLTELDLTRCPLVADDALAATVRASAGTLRTLRLYACSQLGDAPLLALSGGGGGGGAAGGPGVPPRCEGLGARLVRLDCTGLPLLSDAALVAVAGACAQLAELWLSWATGVGDEGAVAVAERCPLRLLSLHGLLRVGEPTRAALVACRAASLTALDVRGCSALPGRERDELKAALPRLTTFVLAK